MQVLLHGKWAKKCENKPILGEMTSYRSHGGRVGPALMHENN